MNSRSSKSDIEPPTATEQCEGLCQSQRQRGLEVKIAQQVQEGRLKSSALHEGQKQRHQPSLHVFSVKSAQDEGVSSAKPSATRNYKQRKFHTKSTLGCLTCKARRIKCDQEKPICQRCRKKQVSCLYLQPHGRNISSCYVRSLQALAAPSRSLWPGKQSPLVVAAEAQDGQDGPLRPDSFDMRLLRHYDTFTSGDIISADAQSVFRGPIMSLALQRPYLMHATLAVSASHLRRLETHVPSHRLAEVLHWQHAISAFSNELAAPLSKDNADPVLLTCLMLNLMSFSFTEDQDPMQSWVFSEAPNRLQWLTIQLGLTPLMMSSRPFRQGSILTPMITSADDGKGTFRKPFQGAVKGTEFLSQDFVKLCGLDAMINPECSPYYLPLCLLTPMMATPRVLENIFIFLKFVGSLREEYMELMNRNEERALLIFGYWLGLMCGMDRWWCQARVKRDCAAICIYLEKKGSPEVTKLLDFPAGLCGHTLKRRPAIKCIE